MVITGLSALKAEHKKKAVNNKINYFSWFFKLIIYRYICISKIIIHTMKRTRSNAFILENEKAWEPAGKALFVRFWDTTVR